MKKIYVKLNGQFQEYEGTQQIRQGLHLDKQIAEQRGDKWEQFNQDNLSDEDKLVFGLITEEEIFNKKKLEKTNEIQSAFNNEFDNGKLFSQTLGIDVDCRRSGKNNDKQNVEGLINSMERNSIPSITYVGYNTTRPDTTKEMLIALVGEMEDHVLSLYQKKWQLEESIKQATTVESLDAIQW